MLLEWQESLDLLGCLAQRRGTELTRRGRHADAIAAYAEAVVWRAPGLKGIPLFLQAQAELGVGRVDDARKHLQEILDRQMLAEESVPGIGARAARELLEELGGSP